MSKVFAYLSERTDLAPEAFMDYCGEPPRSARPEPRPDAEGLQARLPQDREKTTAYVINEGVSAA